MAKEDNEITDMTILSQRDLPEFLELRVKMPRVHKLHWKDEKVSHELVRRIKVLRSSVVEPSNVTSACDKEMKLLGIQDTQSSDNQNSFHDMTSPCAVKNVVEKFTLNMVLSGPKWLQMTRPIVESPKNHWTIFN